MKQTTLCYFIRDNQVLLARKKRGFGVEKWNGAGGKMQSGESVEEAAKRECVEEVGFSPSVLEPRGVIEFHYADSAWSTSCSIFVCHEWTGEMIESEEMEPKWFAFEEIPWDEMWESDRVWFQKLLDGGVVNCKLFFDVEFRLVRSE